METQIPKTMKPVTDEKVAKTTKEDLMQELRVKEETLDAHKLRLNGGFSSKIGREVMSINDELKRIKRLIDIRMIEIQKDGPLQPRYIFENDDNWRKLQRELKMEEINNLKRTIDLVKEQKAKIEKDAPELKARIEVLKKDIQ